MKKTMVLLVAIILGVAMLAGCTTTAFQQSKPIVVVSREEGSGTRGAFVSITGVEAKDAAGKTIDRTTAEATISNGTQVVITTVAGNTYAIGYISLGSLNDTVKALQIDGVAATVANIKAGTYKLYRPFNIAYKGMLSPVAQDFMDYILSEQGQKIVGDNHYIKTDNAKAFTSAKPAGKVVVAGSSSVSPLMEKLGEAYKLVNPNATVEVQTSDSSAGMTAAINGVCDIGMASRAVKDTELAKGLTATVIATDGLAVIVNLKNPIKSLSVAQIVSIYIGQSKTWLDANK
jgi:phosphate transport system substrate-binding protein